MDDAADAAQPSSPTQVQLQLDDLDDLHYIDDALHGSLNLLSELDHDDDDTPSFADYSLSNDLPMPDDPVPDLDTINDQSDPAVQPFDFKREEEPEHDSPFGTPEPEPITPWTEHDARTLSLLLQTAYGPLPVVTIADHMNRGVTDTTAMLVCVWLSVIRVSEQRGARIPWWAGRPVFNSTGFGRVSVFTRNEGQVVLRLYNAQGELDVEAPITDSS